MYRDEANDIEEVNNSLVHELSLCMLLFESDNHSRTYEIIMCCCLAIDLFCPK